MTKARIIIWGCTVLLLAGAGFYAANKYLPKADPWENPVLSTKFSGAYRGTGFIQFEMVCRSKASGTFAYLWGEQLITGEMPQKLCPRSAANGAIAITIAARKDKRIPRYIVKTTESEPETDAAAINVYLGALEYADAQIPKKGKTSGGWQAISLPEPKM